MKSTFNSPPHNNIRDAFIQLIKFEKYNKIIAFSVIEKLLRLGQEFGFTSRFGLQKEKKDSWTFLHWLLSLFLLEHPKGHNSITQSIHKAFLVPCLSVFSDPNCYFSAPRPVEHRLRRSGDPTQPTILVGWSSMKSNNPSRNYAAIMLTVSQI